MSETYSPSWHAGRKRAELLQRRLAGRDVLPFVYCYPPRTAYTMGEAPADLRAVWQRDGECARDLNIYLHVPFCRYRCRFCNLYTVATTESDKVLFRAYVEAIKQDLVWLAPSLTGRTVRSVFVGGGTPLSLGVPLLVELLKALTPVFPKWRATADEVSVEATPDSILANVRDISGLAAAGVNRVSLGVQAFNEPELVRAGRARASTAVIDKAIGILRDARIPNVGTDLIIGLEAQTDQSFELSLDRLGGYDPETISLYLLNPRLGTSTGRHATYSSEQNEALYRRLEWASQRLRERGYVRETSAQFKLPERGGLLQKRLYFSGMSVLGLGSGARSYTATVDYLSGGGDRRTGAEVRSFIERPPSERVVTGVTITPEEAVRRAVILGLQDLDLALVPRGPDGQFAEPYACVLDAAAALGLTERNGNRLVLTEKGFVYRDLICWSLFSDRSIQRHGRMGSEFLEPQRHVAA
jgi:oxygen-independent coproporphyrinogen-3 oxidase